MEHILNEATKRELLDKSKRNVDQYQDKSDGANRFQRRTKQKITRSNKYFNMIDMNNLFKNDVLSFNIKVIGETDSYLVTLEFSGVLEELRARVQPYEEISIADAMRAVSLAFENNDVKVRCTCPDFKYRIAYSLTQDGSIAGEGENRPAIITNPNDSKGRGCKHILKVLNNTGWVNAVASVIRNYIIHTQRTDEGAYAKVIFPAIFQQKYDKEYQMGLFDDELASSEEDIDRSNTYARTKSQFKPTAEEDAEGEIEEKEVPEDNIEVEGQKSFDFDSLA